MKRRWQLWLGLAISAVALYLAVRQIDFQELAVTLVQADYAYLIPAAVGILLYLLTRAIRWRVLLGSEVSLARCFWVTNIGYLVSNVLPFRLGDPARAVIIGRDREISTTAALSTVVVERVSDMVIVVAILAGILPFVSATQDLMVGGLVAAGLAFVAVVVLMLLALRPDWGRSALRWVLVRILMPLLGKTLRLCEGRRGLQWLVVRAPSLDADRWAQTLDGFFEGLAPLRSPRRMISFLGWSVITWGFVVGYYWMFLQAFVTDGPPLAAPFLVCFVGFGMALPSSPSAVGVFHAVARYALTIPFGVAEEEAVALAFGAHAFQYILMVLLGLVGLARESLSLGQVQVQVAHLEKTEEVQ
jgi:hypothetical protein